MSERTFGPCSKCGGSDLLVTFHDSKPHCAECKRLYLSPPSCDFDKCDKRGPHLRVHCRRCQFAWFDKPGIAG